jgi:LuxR family transcriptional regulator, maltose regulon positive regulatory protein
MVFEGDTTSHLLNTKLYPPRLPGGLIYRRHLVEQLDRAPNQLTLVSAPAGYGKSTLVTQWMESGGKHYAWLSLDPYDTDLEMVVAYLISALMQIIPEHKFDTTNLLQNPQPSSPEHLAERFLLDLQNLPYPVFLVLDDYHSVNSREIHDFMSVILRRIPDTLRVILITRVDPPLSLSRTRGNGLLCEIRGADLRFTNQEAAQLIAQIAGEAVDSETAELLANETEGWPVGLRLVAMAYHKSPDKLDYLAGFHAGNQKVVSDYLLAEVLSRLTNQQRLLLLRTSIVERLCAPLIDVLNEQTIPGIKGFDLLEFLWGANFFLVALDSQGTWYRYHHIFRQLLERELARVFSPEAIAGMHMQASTWFEKAGYIEEAIIHALNAGESEQAAVLVEKHVHEVVNQEEWRVVERWVGLLPEAVRERPSILIIQAMLEQFRYRLRAMMQLIDAAQEGLDSGRYDYSFQQQQAWRGVINAYRGTNLLPENSPQDCLYFAQNALEQVSPGARFVRSFAEFWQIYALQQSGKPQEALRLVRRKLASQAQAPDVRTNRLMLAQCAVYISEADVYGLHNAAMAYLDLAVRTKHPISQGWANYLLGWSYYLENNLEPAAFYFQKAVVARQQIHIRAVVDSLTGLAFIHHTRGDQDQVQETLAVLQRFIVEQGVVGLYQLPDSLALRFTASVEPQRDVGHFKNFLLEQLAADNWELPVLTACRMEILRGGPWLLEAEETLIKCETFARSRNSKRQLMSIISLKALLSEVRGEREHAERLLEEAVLLGLPGGALRIFVDTAPELGPCFKRLAANGVAPDYVQKILQTFPADEQVEAVSQPRTVSPEAAALIADLTNREMEVLLLLGERLSNKEISANLYISPGTVKKHTINLYAKMGVENRRQAVSRACELGLINP